MSPFHKKLVWLATTVKTPPLSAKARMEAGYLLRELQAGIIIEMPHSRQMASIGPRCHELRINDKDLTWRVFYRIDEDAIVILHWISKKTQQTAQKDINLCKARLKSYDQI
jgi:phage-related protein